MAMYRKCPICSDKMGEGIRNISMYKLGEKNPLPLTYDVVCCSNCGFAYADVDASQKDYDEYYRMCNMYSENAALKVEETERKEEFEYIYTLFADKIGLDAKIIDIGCGSGDFLAYLLEKGFRNLCGMDPSDKSIKKLREKGIKGICSEISAPVSAEEKHSYDMVISMGVIEHIYDLEDYLRQLTQYMRKDGKAWFLCGCPAVEGFGKYIHAVPDYFNHEHINYFSKISLDNLLNRFSLYRVNEEVYVYGGEGENRGQGLLALYEKKEGSAVLLYDAESARSIRQYFQKVTEKENELEGKIKRILASSKSLVIWGCGAYAMQIIKKYPELLEKVDFFVDNNSTKWGIQVGEKMVYSPEQIGRTYDGMIVICSMLNASDIEMQIQEASCSEECTIIVL